jgi:PAS domain S-box-containing protein
MDTEYRITTPSKKLKHLHTTSFTVYDDLGTPIQLNGATLDITDKYNSRLELDQQNKVIQNTLDIAHIGLWEFGLANRTTTCSRETKKILGLREHESSLSFEVFIAMVHPEDRNSIIDFYNKQALGVGPASFEYRIFIHGQIKSHIVFSDSIRDENNKVSKLSGVLMDVTKTRNTEVGLKETEKLFDSIFENTEDAVFIEDEDGNILNVNAKACHLLNMTRAKLVGSNILDLTPAGEEELVMQNFRRLFDQEITEHTGNTLKNSGEKSSVEIKAKRITYHSTPALLLNVREKK